ncbi:MAG TPA: hypothetical protein PK867_31095, partial [Pirellulales bacterium]|nr:hypothetical protein [Pirellulales bacterium]
REMEGFRLAGFKLVFPAPAGEAIYDLYTFRCEGFVLERCWLHGSVKSLVGGHAGDGGKPACVRECLIEDVLNVASLDNDQAAALVTRNLFVGPNAMATIGRGSVYRYVGIKGNVFAGPNEGVGIHAPKHLGRLQIANNTFLGSNPIVGYDFDVDSIPKGEAIVCNNLRLRPGLLALVAGLTPLTPELSAQQRDAVRRTWRVAHNCYPRELGPGDWAFDQSVARFPGDILRTPRLMSMVAEDRDYLRPAALDPTASAGVGGDWPRYLGAFPPGPAPKEGDWFTRLRERWGVAALQPAAAKSAGLPPPAEIPRPAPPQE